MKAADFIISNHEKLDNILVGLCEMVVAGKKKDPDYYGSVASCVLDVHNNKVCAVNYFKSKGKRVHGERAAIDKYHKKYGKIPEGSIIITTCSPCNEKESKMARKRYGESCTDLINNSNIRKVYCGYMDPSQNEQHNKYTLEVTNNPAIENLCRKFAETFLPNEYTK